MLDKVYGGEIDYLQIMDQDGKIDQQLIPKEADDKTIIEMYRYMNFARALDAKTLSLQRQGRAVTYAPLLGQEATQIGSALALRDGDYFVPNFRQHGVYLVRKLPLVNFFIYWKGYEEGGVVPEGIHGTPVIVPVATQLPHAAGIAYAQRYHNTNAAVVVYVGDGGTSEGDFYEGINFAGVWKLPLVVIIENNGWAISVPRSRQSAAQTLAQKAIAAGVKGIQVDGNDVIAVYKAVKDAIDDSQNGTTVVECLTYRMGMHTTADDPTKYRDEKLVEEWRQKDPIDRVRKYLYSKKLWSVELEAQMQTEFSKQIDDAVEKAEEFKPDPQSMFKNVYSYVPQVLQDEYDDAVREGFWQGEMKV
jgi:pyruvate dehydrogenase E1 component alpha subunit